jgi:hypothetical protein
LFQSRVFTVDEKRSGNALEIGGPIAAQAGEILGGPLQDAD